MQTETTFLSPSEDHALEKVYKPYNLALTTIARHYTPYGPAGFHLPYSGKCCVLPGPHLSSTRTADNTFTADGYLYTNLVIRLKIIVSIPFCFFTYHTEYRL